MKMGAMKSPSRCWAALCYGAGLLPNTLEDEMRIEMRERSSWWLVMVGIAAVFWAHVFGVI